MGTTECLYMHHMHAVPAEVGRGHRIPGTEDKGSCESLCVHWEPKPVFLKEQRNAFSHFSSLPNKCIFFLKVLFYSSRDQSQRSKHWLGCNHSPGHRAQNPFLWSSGDQRSLGIYFWTGNLITLSSASMWVSSCGLSVSHLLL